MPDPTSQSASVMPTKIGRYAILRKLGQGGMGAVYEAEHTKLQKRVALKVLPPEVSNDPAAVARFEREMVAVGRVSHPGIIGALDADEADGVAYLAMELVDGEDVSEVIEFYEEKTGKPIPLSVACEIIRQAALAMQAAHEAGLVHRDLKPSNLMLGRDGNVKVLDLGLALLDAKHGDGGPLTSTGQVMGTVDYMAPEQAAETHTVDARADVYSLGATLYRLIAGKAPYPSDRFSSMLQKLMAVANTEPTPLQELRPKCPEKLADLVNLTMAKDPDKRLATANDLAERLAPAGDANMLAQLAQQIPERKPVDRAAIEATQAGSSDVEATGTMTPATEPRMSADPTVDTDHNAEATFINAPSENAPTFIGADGSQTITTPTSATQWKRKKKPAVPAWAWGIGAAVVAVLIAIPLLSTSSPEQDDNLKNEIVESRDATRTDATATQYLSQRDLKQITQSGLSFTDKDAAVDCGDIKIDVGKGFTIEMWCQPEPLPPIDGRASNVGVSLGPIELKRYRDDAMPSEIWQCGVRKATNRPKVDGASFESFYDRAITIQPVLQHVAAQWDGNAMQMFIDGRPLAVDSAAFSGGVRNPDRNRVARKLLTTLPNRGLRIGSATDSYLGQSSETQFSGTIHQVRLSSNARYTGPFSPAPLTTDNTTQAFYSFQEGTSDVLHDLSDNGHHGKIVGAKWVNDQSDTSSSHFAGGLKFDGVDDWVDIDSLRFDGSHPITLEAYIILDRQDGPRGIVSDQYGGGIGLATMNDSVGVVITEEDGKPRANHDQPIPIGKRAHVAGTWDGKQLQFFLDGTLVATAETTREKYIARRRFAIGSYPQGKNGFFDGVIDEVRISRAVRYTENFEPANQFISDEKTIALYHFDEGAGDILHDSSGNGHHGKIVGAEWVHGKDKLSTTNEPLPLAPQPGLTFPQADARVDVGALSMDLVKPFTLELWCRLADKSEKPRTKNGGVSNVAAQIGPLIVKETIFRGGESRWQILTDTAHSYSKSLGHVALSDDNMAAAGKTQHVAMIWTGSEIKLYVDGRPRSLSSLGRRIEEKNQETQLREIMDTFSRAELIIGSARKEFQDFSSSQVNFEGQIYQLRVSDGVHYQQPFQPSSLVAQNNTIALYHFDEGSGNILKDSSGNGHDGKIIGATWVEGGQEATRGGLQFSGPEDQVKVTSIPYDMTQPFTAEIWCTPDFSAVPAGKYHFAAFEVGPPEFQFQSMLFKSNGSFSSQASALGREPGKVIGGTRIGERKNASSKRTHFAIQWDGTNARHFVDGVLAPASNEVSGTDKKYASSTQFLQELVKPTQTIFFSLGHPWHPRKQSESFIGTMDSFRFSNKTRYASSFTPAEFAKDDNTVALYKFDEGSGDILKDSSGNGHDGKIVGATWVGSKSQTSSLDFQTPGDRVTVPDLPVDLQKPFTIESWFTLGEKRDSTSPNRYLASIGPVILKAYQHKGGQFIQAGVSGFETKINTWAGVSESYPMPKQSGSPTHVAYVFDGQDFQLFVNGSDERSHTELVGAPLLSDIQLKQYALDLLMRNQNTMFEIGTSGSLPQNEDDNLGGQVFEVRISQAAKYSAPFQPQTRLPADQDTIALYHFDEGTGDILTDSSGNGHHGKIIGAKWLEQQASAVTATATPQLAIAPYDESQAKAHQKAWADYLDLPVEKNIDLPDGQEISFTLIPPGQFTMGSSDDDIARFKDWWGKPSAKNGLQSETPAHPVRLSQPLYLGTYEITHKQFQAFARTADIAPQAGASSPLTVDQHPAVNISWYDATAFCTWLGEATGFEVRLPTEAEWEYACRAGTESAFYFGNNINEFDKFGRYWADPNGATRPRRPDEVGSRLSNAFGLYDMHGNAMEWCADWFADPYPSDALAIDPTGPESGRLRVRRGGSWNFTELNSRSASRLEGGRGYRSDSVGFRVAMPIDLVTRKPIAKRVHESKIVGAKSGQNSLQPREQSLPVDILAKIDLGRDIVRGDWTIANGELLGTNAISRREPSVLELPFTLPDSYSLAVDFERTQENQSFNINLPVGDRSVCFILDGFPQLEKHLTGLQRIDGRPITESPFAINTITLENHRPYKFHANVQLQSDNATLTIGLDGKPLVTWTGEISRLGPAPMHQGRDDKKVSLSVQNGQFIFSKITASEWPQVNRQDEASILGHYEISWNEEDSETGISTYEFRDDRQVFKGTRLIGNWSRSESEFRIDFIESVRGHANVTIDQDQLTGKHFWEDGRISTWQGKRLPHKETP